MPTTAGTLNENAYGFSKDDLEIAKFVVTGGTEAAVRISAGTQNPINVNLQTALSGLLSGAENDTILTAPYYRADAFQAQIGTTDATGTPAIKAATASKSIYITDIVLSVNTAVNVKFQDGTAFVMVPNLFLPGSATWSKSFTTPLKVPGTNSFNVLASGTGNVDVAVTGYVI